MGDEPVIYREEVLTIMAVLGDQRAELEQIRRLLEGEDDEEEERAEFERRSEANLRRLRELVDRGWAGLERKGVTRRPH